MAKKKIKSFLLVEPVAKTPYPPLGLMKIGSWLRKKYKGCSIHDVVGTDIPKGVRNPTAVYVTSLFTWDMSHVTQAVNFFRDRFPRAELRVGGIAASVLPEHIRNSTGVRPHVGLLRGAEGSSPDYTLRFGRELNSSIVFTSRGCPRSCSFCSVSVHEPDFKTRGRWARDVSPDLPKIQVWDNNFLASPDWPDNLERLSKFGKWIDFNQGLDARLFTAKAAKLMGGLKIDPIRFAFDNARQEKAVVCAIERAKKHASAEIKMYVLYNYKDTPADFFHRIDLLNRLNVLSFPMEYRQPTPLPSRLPGRHWNKALLRGLKLSLLFYYRGGTITASRKAFHAIYGRTAKQFVSRLYDIFERDRQRKPKRKTGS